MTDLTQLQNDLHCLATNILWITSCVSYINVDIDRSNTMIFSD